MSCFAQSKVDIAGLYKQDQGLQVMILLDSLQADIRACTLALKMSKKNV